MHAMEGQRTVGSVEHAHLGFLVLGQGCNIAVRLGVLQTVEWVYAHK